ncbi:hypothetical protein CLTEP_11290 [Clostridium tepidiprofundi DSM 19306]|uniref:Small, acid-soluble spore protein, alpha/beta type n=2 Tax=Clostridium TaxID=1485 RepID=A0A151B4Y1_9CLOT|nr:hypothetical protein CLTEP_11290 [Clostridium tepidiprofundi DSM 19306]
MKTFLVINASRCKMSHKNNKNNKDNKKVNQKTKKEVRKMQFETSNELGVSNESKKLGKKSGRVLLDE